MPTGTRERLLDAATALLDAGGVPAVTLREVGHRSGVSHNAPYKHFAGKDDLLAEVAARELRRRTEAWTAARAGAPPDAALHAMLQDHVAWALTHRERFRLVFRAWDVGSPALHDAATEARTTFLAAVVAAQDAGALPAGDPARLAALLQSVAHGAADLASAGHLAPGGKGNASASDLVDDVLARLRDAVRG